MPRPRSSSEVVLAPRRAARSWTEFIPAVLFVGLGGTSVAAGSAVLYFLGQRADPGVIALIFIGVLLMMLPFIRTETSFDPAREKILRKLYICSTGPWHTREWPLAHVDSVGVETRSDGEGGVFKGAVIRLKNKKTVHLFVLGEESQEYRIALDRITNLLQRPRIDTVSQ